MLASLLVSVAGLFGHAHQLEPASARWMIGLVSSSSGFRTAARQARKTGGAADIVVRASLADSELDSVGGEPDSRLA